MHSFDCSHPNSVKWSWETGNLREVGNYAWGSFFTESGRGIGWATVLIIWVIYYAKKQGG